MFLNANIAYFVFFNLYKYLLNTLFYNKASITLLFKLYMEL